ncbi:MAG: hypothetical protein J7M24_08460 [Candidatus Latescibacteria bacterium]|nr:hypothetical protein [Candidatus Latescibacterota bacterium]
MKNMISSLLVPLSSAVYAAVSAIPMWAVWGIVFGVIALLAGWIMLLPPQIPGKSESERPYSLVDLRVFALFVLAIQALLYIVF